METYKFIEPIKDQLTHGDYNKQPTKALDITSYQKWLGFSFERFCRSNHRLIATILGFSDVRYTSGVFFNRETNSINPGYQIDLIFKRSDKVITICELKYLQAKVGIEVIETLERKLKLFHMPPQYTVQRVLTQQRGSLTH